MNAGEKTLEIFRELVGERAGKLAGTHYPADINDQITAAMLGEADWSSIDDPVRLDGVGFHLVDWRADAAFLVALVLFPERFTNEEIRDGVENLLIHVPAHIQEAARLAGYPAKNIFPEETPEKPAP